MTAWQRRLLFVFVVLGLILISRVAPEGSGELQQTDFANIAEPLPAQQEEVAVVPVVVEEPAVVETPKAPKKDKQAKPERKQAAVEAAPVAPSTYKRVSIDMTDYVPPEPRPSRFIASVDKKITSSKGDFALANVVAVETAKYDSSMGEEIEEKAGFTVYKPANVEPSFVIDDRTRPVVVNRSSGAIGIVTGTVVVRLKDFSEAEALASAFGLEEVSSDDTIATVFYRVPKGREIDDLIELLRADGRVARADAEIIQASRQVH